MNTHTFHVVYIFNIVAQGLLFIPKENIQVLERISSSVDGAVYKGVWIDNGNELVAIKKVLFIILSYLHMLQGLCLCHQFLIFLFSCKC